MDESHFTVITVNFGVGKERRLVSEIGRDRVLSLGAYVETHYRCSHRIILAIQEFDSTSESGHNLLDRLKRRIGSNSSYYYAAAISTSRYPVARKWQKWWSENMSTKLEEGLATYAVGPQISLSDPETVLTHHRAPVFRGRVVDLPNLEFSRVGGEGWQWDKAIPDRTLGRSSDVIHFRDTYYRGNRDSAPRIATAHRVRLSTGGGVREAPEFIFVNLHLATLKEEDSDEAFYGTADELSRSQRIATVNSSYLRYRQLSVVKNYIESVYRDLRLPVVIAGDFNTLPNAPEMTFFARSLSLISCFNETRCYNCGSEIGSLTANVALYSNELSPMVLTRDPIKFEKLTGLTPRLVSRGSFCANEDCLMPLFSHKANLSLIDNVLFTDSRQLEGSRLRWQIEPVFPKFAGADLETYFSDHLPLWCRFKIAEPYS